MQTNSVTAILTPMEIRIKGRTKSAPSAQIDGRTIVVTGSFLKQAQVFDEELVEGGAVPNPSTTIAELKRSGLNADLFTFTQRPPETIPKFDYHFEWDNWAVVPTNDFNDWWEKRLPQESRKNVRLSVKKGVTVKTVAFTDELVTGIQGIYNETPVRQGKRFWHYGKDFDTVKLENQTYIERSEFIGAFLNDELIGFIKWINVDRAAILIQILAKDKYRDKRPMNALLAHAVRLCEEKQMSMLVYGQYVYGKKNDSPLTEFKRRNGFEQINYPRYFVPLSMRGRLAIASGLHLGPGNLLPKRVSDFMLDCRARFLSGWRVVYPAVARDNRPV